MSTDHIDRMRRFDTSLGFDEDKTNFNIPFMDTSSASQAMDAIQALSTAADVADTQIVYDLDSVLTTANSCKDSFDGKVKAQLSSSDGFTSPFVHCYAVKACAVSYILHTMVQNGLGMECASINEVRQSLRCGCPPDKVIFDSPCKTTKEISEVMSLGVNFNINSVKELEKVQAVWSLFAADSSLVGSLEKYTSGAAFIGLRVNPLVGAGSIAALSVATAFSKFGIPLYSNDYILELFKKYSFLNGIMCHVGSQGMSIDAMVRGVRALLDVAQMVEPYKLKCFDIGGGLSVNYQGDSVSPSFEDYSAALLVACPELFLHANIGPAIDRPTNQWRIFTEFGKSLISKTACVVSRVEDVIFHNSQDTFIDQDTGESSDEPQVTAVIHAGADLFLRQCYCPEKFKHRVALLNSHFKPTADDRVMAKRVSIAGPLCFGGDVVQRSVPMHVPQCGDFVVALDAGANTISLFSRHCSRPSPAVFAVRRSVSGVMVATKIRDEETSNEVCAFWG